MQVLLGAGWGWALPQTLRHHGRKVLEPSPTLGSETSEWVSDSFCPARVDLSATSSPEFYCLASPGLAPVTPLSQQVFQEDRSMEAREGLE